jgi:pentatricopeptide repeat protein
LYHGVLRRPGLAAHAFLANLLIRVFAACGSSSDAHHVFARCILRPDAYTWSAIISASSAAPADGEECHRQDLGRRQAEEELCYGALMHADAHVLSAMLSACARRGDVLLGRLIHAHIIAHAKLEPPPPSVANSLLAMYAKCGSFDDAFAVAEAVPSRCRDVVTWGTLISTCSQHGSCLQALHLFHRLQREGSIKPNEIVFSAVVKACSTMASARCEGRIVHMNAVEDGFEADGFIASSLISMYANHGSLRDAWEVFDRLTKKDAVTWTSMIDAFIHHGDCRGAFSMFLEMGRAGIDATDITFLSIVKVFGSNGCLSDGMLLHAYAVETGIRMDMPIGSALINFYCNCSSLEDACSIFERLRKRDVVAWDAMLAGCLERGKRDAALQYFFQMQMQCLKPSKVTCVIILQAFSVPDNMEHGKLMHAQIVEHGYEQDTAVGNSLINMYSKQAHMRDAHAVFDALIRQDVVTWGALIGGHIEKGNTNECLELFQKMYESQEIHPDETILIYQLKTCSSSDEGKLTHAYATEHRGYLTSSIVNALIHMYSEVEELDDAAKIFDMCVEKDVTTWTSMIQGLTNSGCFEEVSQMFTQMQTEGVEANQLTFVNALKAGSSLYEGKQLHARLVHCSFAEDRFLGNCLIDMYAKCGDLVDACVAFEKLPFKDTVTWNIIIACCIEQSKHRLVLDYFEDMQRKSVKPDSATFSSLFTACNHMGLVTQGCQYFTLMRDNYGIVPTVDHVKNILDLLGQAGLLQEADGFLQSAPFPSTRTTWFSLLRHCRSHGNISLGEMYFDQLIGLHGGLTMTSSFHEAGG